MKIPNPGYETCCICGREFDEYHRCTDYVKTKRKTELWFNRDCKEIFKNDKVKKDIRYKL